MTRSNIKRVPWAEPFPRLFRLIGDGWTPPAEVVIRQGSRTWTYVADCLMDDGQPARLSVKIDPVRNVVLDETLTMRFRVVGRSK